ncbi:MAG: hypothetical protein MUF51_03270 [Vicinamibacteria bacterium]|jgi:hypothetical protein|nr:hypothetical protein [Vicinamibacteria bacterium]
MIRADDRKIITIFAGIVRGAISVFVAANRGLLVLGRFGSRLLFDRACGEQGVAEILCKPIRAAAAPDFHKALHSFSAGAVEMALRRSRAMADKLTVRVR